MRRYKEALIKLFTNRIYVISAIVSVVMAYGYEITHCSLSADDICIDLYFKDGLGVSIGRWPFFIMANWFRLNGISKYIPFVDVVGVLILILAAAIWAVYIQQIAGLHGINIGYAELSVFTCFFISYSLIAQVWIYYLHNGIALGYLLVGMTLLILLSYFEGGCENRKKSEYLLLESTGLICLAISFYESMMIVFLFGVSLYLLIKYYRKDKVDTLHIFNVVMKTAVIAGGAILLRYIIIRLIALVYSLPVASRQPKVKMLSIDRISELVVKTFCQYFLLPEYQPIRLFMMCTVWGFLFLLYDMIKQRRVRLLVIATITLLSFFAISVFGNYVLPYRTMQALSVYVAFCMVVFIHKCGNFKDTCGINRGGIVAWLITGIIIWNNFCEINYSFYMEYENYQYNRTKIANIGFDLKKIGYDADMDKVLFVGSADDLPYPREEDYIRPGSIWDRTRNEICTSIGIDNEVIGASYYQNMTNNALEWAVDAFGSQQQFVNFFSREGFRIVSGISESNEITAEEIDLMRGYPEEGYIVKHDNLYVIKLN